MEHVEESGEEHQPDADPRERHGPHESPGERDGPQPPGDRRRQAQCLHGGSTGPQREDPAEEHEPEGPLLGLLRRLGHGQRDGGPEAGIVRDGLGAFG